jgi:hypothetical protein
MDAVRAHGSSVSEFPLCKSEKAAPSGVLVRCARSLEISQEMGHGASDPLMANSKKRSSPLRQLMEASEQARPDFETLLQISDPERLLEALSSEPDLVAAPDPTRASVAEVAAKSGLDVDATWSVIRVFDWLCRQHSDNSEIVQSLIEDLIELGLVRQNEGERITAFFDRGLHICMPALLQRWEIASIMQTFRSIEYACDLRLIGDDEDTSTVPVCVVRIQADEGEPFVFQCMSTDLSRLIEVLKDAQRRLSDSLSK